MENIIKAAVERGASDLHIKAGDVFRARIDGELRPLTKQRLTPEQTKSIALQLIPIEEDRKRPLPYVILRTMYDARTSHSKAISAQIKEIMGEHVLETVIKLRVDLKNASSWGQSVLQYSGNSEAATAYRQLAQEVMNHG